MFAELIFLCEAGQPKSDFNSVSVCMSSVADIMTMRHNASCSYAIDISMLYTRNYFDTHYAIVRNVFYFEYIKSVQYHTRRQ